MHYARALAGMRTGAARVRVQRHDILDFETYESRRPVLRPELMLAKRSRQVLVGDVLNLMFESHETVRYQIQEILRVEAVTDEVKIEREIETYNRLLGAPGELGCTLLVELAGAECAVGVDALVGLDRCLYVRMPEGHRVFAHPTVGDANGAFSLVHFLSFAVAGVAPVAVGCSHPRVCAEVGLTREQRQTLAQDLALEPANRLAQSG